MPTKKRRLSKHKPAKSHRLRPSLKQRIMKKPEAFIERMEAERLYEALRLDRKRNDSEYVV